MRGLTEVCVTNRCSHVLICGDFNYPDIDWTDEAACGLSNDASTFVECLRDCFLYQHVRTPTRNVLHQTFNVLDLVLTNGEFLIQDLKCGAHVGNSDHNFVTFNYMCCAQRSCILPKKFLYDKGNYVKLRSDFNMLEWEVDENTTTEELWTLIRTRIDTCMRNNIPLTSGKLSKKPKPMWMNDSVLEKTKKKNNAFKKYMVSRTKEDYDDYARMRNQTKWECKKAIRSFERHVALEAKRDPKAFF